MSTSWKPSKHNGDLYEVQADSTPSPGGFRPESRRTLPGVEVECIYFGAVSRRSRLDSGRSPPGVRLENTFQADLI
jgi:hypothetical protein